MFLCSKDLIRKIFVSHYSHLTGKKLRKVVKKLSPQKYSIKQGIRAFFFAPLQAALTVEAAIVVPIFLFFMIGVMQYGNVMETAVRFGTSLAETGKTMAMAAYVSRYGGDAGSAAELAVGALSAVYAHSTVMDQAGDTSAVKNANLALSSFLKEDESIDLILTYQMRSPFAMVRLPGTFFIQRAKVRAWTGRIPPKKGDGSGEDETAKEMVYVTATGKVYHDDPDCTHLKLSVRAVDVEALGTVRNHNGGIYHACEKCGDGPHGSTVYITEEGNRYHSTLGCSGLKRTVRQITKEEAGNLRACTKCGKGH